MNTTSFLSHKIYPQTGVFSFLFGASFDSTTGVTQFGFSGANALFKYTFSSGRILDNVGRFIGAYQANKEVFLSGVVTPRTFDITVDGEQRAFGLPKSTGLYNSAFVNSNGVAVEFDLFVNGAYPSYSLSALKVFQTGASTPVTGYIINNSNLPFYVFSGEYKGDDSFVLVSFPTGSVSHSGAFVLNALGQNAGGAHSLPFTLFTDFGLIDLSLPFSGDNSPPPTYFIDLFGGTDFTNDSEPVNYLCSFGDPNSLMSVVPIFEYLSGSGIHFDNVVVTGNYTGQVSGFITGSGYLTGYFTGFASGYAGTEALYTTGNIQTVVSQLGYVTGTFSEILSILSSGRATGIGYSGLATGILTGLFTGTTTNGTLFPNLTVTGLASGIKPLSPTGFSNATGQLNLNGLQENDMFLIGDTGTALIYPYSFVDGLSLATYLNGHTGIHKVTASVSGLVVNLKSVYKNFSGNGTVLLTDGCNHGTAGFNLPFLTGGGELYPSVVQVGSFTGSYKDPVYLTGFVIASFTGHATGTVSGIDYLKNMSGVWSFKTGLSNAPADLVDVPYREPLWSGDTLSSTRETFYLQVSYHNIFDTSADVARLTISGVNHPTGLALNLSGTP